MIKKLNIEIDNKLTIGFANILKKIKGEKGDLNP